MSKKSAQTKAQRFREGFIQLRETYWPKLKDNDIWKQDKSVGYAPVPRIMPYVMRGLDELCEAKVSTTYLTLWFRMVEGIVKIENEKLFAFESGFSGQRDILSWRDRMSRLVKYKIIFAKSGPCGEYSVVFVRNPYAVLCEIKDKITEAIFTGAFDRAQSVSADKELKCT